MVAVNYSADIEHIDDAVREAEQERPGLPIRVRVQPTVFRRTAGQDGQHKAWAGVHWTLECANAEEAVELREALRVFFDAVGVLSPREIRERLTQDMIEATAPPQAGGAGQGGEAARG